MTIGRDVLTKAETITVAAIEASVPTLVEAREIIAEFHLMIRRSAGAELLPWIERARASLVASFARGVTNDEAAVQAAITSRSHRGQAQGRRRTARLKRGTCRVHRWRSRTSSAATARHGAGPMPAMSASANSR